MTDVELLALILATGTRSYSAIDLARSLREHYGSLKKMSQVSVRDLMQHRGIGQAKAISLVACFELGRRRETEQSENVQVRHSADVASFISPGMKDQLQEVFVVVFLNRNHQVVGQKELFRGGVAATIIDPKLVFREAMHHLASGIIVAHNHPSGSLTPSKADIEITKKLAEGGKWFDIKLLDHLIISDKGYYSFADEGLL